MFLRLALIGFLSAGLAVSPAMGPVDTVQAAAKKPKKALKNRSQYTPEQREKILEEARRGCKKKFGAAAQLYRVDYATGRIWCTQG